MAVKTEGSGMDILDGRIQCLKYILIYVSGIMWILGAVLFGLCIWLRADSEIGIMVSNLKIFEFYTGLYVLIAASVVIILIAIFSCAASLMENYNALYMNVGLQVLSYSLLIAGSAVLLNYSTNNSEIQPLIKNAMYGLIKNANHQHEAYTLQSVQAGVGCCGAIGATDYTSYRKPVPPECRDTLTGNVYPYGCAEGITWYLEGRTTWIVGLAFGIGLMNVIQGVLSLIVIKALQKEDAGVN